MAGRAPGGGDRGPGMALEAARVGQLHDDGGSRGLDYTELDLSGGSPRKRWLSGCPQHLWFGVWSSGRCHLLMDGWVAACQVAACGVGASMSSARPSRVGSDRRSAVLRPADAVRTAWRQSVRRSRFFRTKDTF